MFFEQIKYNQPLFRPPAEANSLILQATYGCSWNKCAFCEMYSTKNFKIRSIDEINFDINSVLKSNINFNKIFLADGNAFVLNFEKLIKIINSINISFPKVRRISAYAMPKDIENKTLEQLIELKQNGLNLLYVGIETGNEELLKLINKSETYNSTLDGLLKAKKAGIKLSIMILNGLGGKNYSQQHASDSAKIINLIQPEFLSTLVLTFPFGEYFYTQKFKGNFISMNKIELANELKLFLENVYLQNTIFRSDHASNYIILKGMLNKDKERILKEIDMNS